MSEFTVRHYAPGSAESRQVSLKVSKGILELSDGASMSLTDIELDVGGSHNNRIVLKNKTTGDTLITEDRALLAEIKKSGGSKLAVEANKVETRIKKEPLADFGHWAAAAVILALTGLFVFASLDWMVGTIASRIPPEIETKLGELVLESYKSKHRLESSGADVERVRRIGERLVKELDHPPYKFTFYVEQSKDINAFAVPGGNVVVLSRLLNEAENDSEVAGVLAHEIGHVVKRHSLRAALRQAGWIVCLRLLMGGMERDASAMMSYFVNLESLGYGRSQESEADMTGLHLAAKAGYKPEGLIVMFERLKKENPAIDNKTLEFISNHPMPTERINMIRAEIERMKKAQ